MKTTCCIVSVLIGISSVSASVPPQNSEERTRQLFALTVEQTRQGYNQSGQVKIKPEFIPLPAGFVTPQGWLGDWAHSAAKGITGHLDERDDTFRYGWTGKSFEALGGKEDGTGWPLEQCAYWLDGLVRLAYILQDPALIDKAKSRLDPLVDGVLKGESSFIHWRPKSQLDTPFDNWAHSHIGRAMAAYYQATGDKRILDALVKVYGEYPLPALTENLEHVEGAVNLDPMLETYFLSGEEKIYQAVMSMAAKESSVKTVHAWCQAQSTPSAHTVIFYENIRVPLLLSILSEDPRFLQATQNMLDVGERFNKLPMGLCSGEEYLAGIGSTRNIETCDVAAALWTCHWLLRTTGLRQYADRMEQIFFNAGPGPVTRDFQQACYYQSPNRFGNRLPSERPLRPRTKKGVDSYTFGPAGHEVLCCVGNLNRILPTYIMNMWMATPDGGLAATLYGPCQVQSLVADGVPVVIRSQTNYPFQSFIQMEIQPKKPVSFPLSLRVPDWCTSPKVQINGKAVEIGVNTMGFVRLQQDWQMGDRIELEFPMEAMVFLGRETPYPQTKYFLSKGNRSLCSLTEVSNPYASVYWGPLLMALALPERSLGNTMEDIPCHYALDLPDGDCRDMQPIFSAMPKIWDWPEHSPLKLRVKAVQFEWQPTELHPLPADPVKTGEPAELELIPIGCTKSRMSMFPVTQQVWDETARGDSIIVPGCVSK